MKKKIILFILIAVAMIIGDTLAVITADYLPVLSKGGEFGFTPFTLPLAGCSLTFGLMFSMNVCQFIFLVVAVCIYPKVNAVLDI